MIVAKWKSVLLEVLELSKLTQIICIVVVSHRFKDGPSRQGEETFQSLFCHAFIQTNEPLIALLMRATPELYLVTCVNL